MVDALLALNLQGAMHLIRAVLPHMLERYLALHVCQLRVTRLGWPWWCCALEYSLNRSCWCTTVQSATHHGCSWLRITLHGA